MYIIMMYFLPSAALGISTLSRPHFITLKMTIIDSEGVALDIDNINISRVYIAEEAEECAGYLNMEGEYITIINQNIRSINKNFDDFVLLLNRINTNVDIIILTECWLSDSSPIPNVSGCKYVLQNHKFSKSK